MAEDEERAPWWRYAIAGALGLSLLGMTYVLFDPELGTPVPLFQEFTCHSRLLVTATDPLDRPTLHTPEMALKLRAVDIETGEVRPAYYTLMKREPAIQEGAWREYFTVKVPGGEHLMHVSPVANETEVYAIAKDLEGKICAGKSVIVRVEANASITGPSSPEPEQP